MTFATALANYNVLYVETEDGCADGYEPMVGITTLEEYFSWLKTLGAINRKYTVLPLDKDKYFSINANTRAITIPADFKKNGVAVQSDDLAEVLYFKIDRYFDYMDLNNTDIFIQWETPKGPDGKTVKSVSPAYIRDIESHPGELVFGWALSDMITPYAGQLKFSVRFFQWENPENAATEEGEKVLAYSLSTLVATVDIKPSINLDLEKDEYAIDDCGNRLIERLENSVISGGYAAAVPEFVVNVEPVANGYDLVDGTYELLVQAFASDTGAINYVWKRQDLNEDNTTTDAVIATVPSENKFVEADMSKLNAAYAYYEQSGTNGDGEPIYVRYTGSIPPSEEEVLNGLVLFNKQSRCVADNYGEYWAVAENRITNSVAHNESAKAKFPRPEYINISSNPEAKVILVEDAEGTLSANLNVTVANKDGKLSFQWYKDENKDLNFDVETSNFVAISGQTAATMIASEEGHYRVEITNTRNTDDKIANSEISRVTKHAEIPVVTFPKDLNFSNKDLEAGICFSIEIDPTVYSDYYEVEWFKFNEDAADERVHYDRVSVGEFFVEFNPYDHTEPDDEGNINCDGRYYPIVTNNVNGSVKATAAITDVDAMFTLM